MSKLTAFADMWDQVMPPGIVLNLQEGPGQQGCDYYSRPTHFGRDYFTMRFLHLGEKNDLGYAKYGFEVERWQTADGDRWRTRECRAADGKPYWSEDLAPKPAWHRWHHTQRMSGRFLVYGQWPKVFQSLGHALWWVSDQLWTLGEDHSGWKWDGIEAMQARHEQIWAGGDQ